MSAFNPTRATILSLSQKLNLPREAADYGDWEYVVTDPDRISDFLELYQNDLSLNDNEKQTLAIVLIGSFDDAVLAGIFSEEVWKNTVRLFERDAVLLLPVLNYWACWDTEDIDDCFYITQRMRELIAGLSR
jgi:hypothetical protein